LLDDKSLINDDQSNLLDSQKDNQDSLFEDGKTGLGSDSDLDFGFGNNDTYGAGINSADSF